MKEKSLNATTLYVAVGIAAPVILLCLFFLLASVRAQLALQRIGISVPTLVSEKQRYYRHAQAAIQEAMVAQPDNALHYLKKADYLWDAIRETDTPVDKYSAQTIEESYKKAVELNPLNYVYHLQAGRFYLNQRDMQQAGKYLEAARDLYPQDYLPYFYLSDYYFHNDQPSLGFSYLMMTFSRYMLDSLVLFAQVDANPRKSQSLEFTRDAHVISYTFPVNAPQFDLKTQQFPHERIPIRLRVYIDSPGVAPQLYRQKTLVGPLEKIEQVGEYTVYQAAIDSFPKGVYLDDFMVWVPPPARIEKVECGYVIWWEVKELLS